MLKDLFTLKLYCVTYSYWAIIWSIKSSSFETFFTIGLPINIGSLFFSSIFNLLLDGVLPPLLLASGITRATITVMSSGLPTERIIYKNQNNCCKPPLYCLNCSIPSPRILKFSNEIIDCIVFYVTHFA